MESEFIKQSKHLNSEEMLALSKIALDKESEFMRKWESKRLEPGTTSSLFCKNWQKKNEIFERIKRITEMEIYFDTLLETCDTDSSLIFKDADLHEMFQKLTAYYDGPDWRLDFESDERGELPQGLKRGVLSEDGIYNLIESIK